MIKTVTDSLQRLYYAFIDEQDDWFFFLGLAEYMQYVRTNELTAPIVKITVQPMNDFGAAIEEAEQGVKKSLWQHTRSSKSESKPTRLQMEEALIVV